MKDAVPPGPQGHNWIDFHLRKTFLTQPGALEKDWRSMPDLPTEEELLSPSDAEILIKPVDPNPGTKEEYLGTQYKLCRVEATELVRRAIRLYREDPEGTKTNDFYIYTNVHSQGFVLSHMGAASRLSFSTTRTQEDEVDWRRTDRLTPGKLLVLSPRDDAFRSRCIVATVAGRQVIGGLEPDLAAGESPDTLPRIDVFWSNYDDVILDPDAEMIMIETKGGYFESLRHTMVGLQQAMYHESKFDHYIVDLSEEQYLAGYLASPAAVSEPDIVKEFDVSQQTAFDRMTRQEMAIIQGPPGTGKTFTSVGALQSLTETFGKMNPSIPVIVAAETNHALDQLLAACMQAFQANIVRLGGRSEDEDVSNRSLFKLRKASKAARTDSRVKKQRDSLQEAIAACLSPCFPGDNLISAKTFLDAGIITTDQFSSLENMMEDDLPDCTNPIDLWLEHKVDTDSTVKRALPQEHNEDSQDQGHGQAKPQGFIPDKENDDERNKLEGPFIPTKLYTARASGRRVNTMGSASLKRASGYLEKHSDLYNIRANAREMVYQYMRHQLIIKTTPQLQHLVQYYQKGCNEMTISRWKNNIQVIREEGIQIIGCTTTGLTKYRGLIASLEPKVLLVEEAAEALEAKITSALYPTLDQLILVGDHQQLVPSVSVQELGLEPYNFNVSLFERLVYAGLPFTMLNTQRRMIPDIRQIVQTFYPEIVDHPSVNDKEQRAPVPGMNGINHWWFDHSFPDYRTPTMSRSNLAEAKMIAGFAKYLIQNGIMPSQITVLSYYKAQLDLLEKELGFGGTCCTVRTVDGFQGEQNDIILLSLVRSCNASERTSPGFVENENRAVVALSRAKRGLFVFGCRAILHNSATSNETWTKVLDVFIRQERIGQIIPLTCEKHGNVTQIEHPDDWDRQTPNGGCSQRCEDSCASGHPCSMMCHSGSPCKCQKPCEQKLPCGHKCKSRCGEACKCAVKTCGIRRARGERGPGSSNTSRASSQEGNVYKTTEDMLNGGFRSSAAGQSKSPTKSAPKPAQKPEHSNWTVEVQRKDKAHAAKARQAQLSPVKAPAVKHVERYTHTKIDSRGARVVESQPRVTITTSEVLVDLSEDPSEESKATDAMHISGPLLVGDSSEKGAASMEILGDLLS